MRKLDIIAEDKYLIVVNKPSGLLTIATEKEKRCLYNEVKEYVKKQNPKNKIFIVHRLDKHTSGIILFAKSEKVKYMLQNNWNDNCLLREYIAIVEGVPKKREDKLINFLAETKTFYTYVTENKKVGKKANFAVLDKEFNVLLTIRNGEIIYKK